jgi:hypothetical protein
MARPTYRRAAHRAMNDIEVVGAVHVGARVGARKWWPEADQPTANTPGGPAPRLRRLLPAVETETALAQLIAHEAT